MLATQRHAATLKQLHLAYRVRWFRSCSSSFEQNTVSLHILTDKSLAFLGSNKAGEARFIALAESLSSIKQKDL
jgi:hypothetical protein